MKSLLVFSGLLLTGLGIAGIFLPLLPTTPFLLAASFCFVRSSPALHKWLLNHRVWGGFIRNYINHRSITLRTKIITILFLWTTLIISMYAVKSVYAYAGLSVVGILVSTHLLMLKTLKEK